MLCCCRASRQRLVEAVAGGDKKTVTHDLPKAPPEPQRLPPSRRIGAALDVDAATLMQTRLAEISKLLWIPEGMSEQQKNAQITRALELYEGIDPADGAEGMLAMQMVGTHMAALESLRRANLPNQTYEGRDLALKYAHKLMALYTQQLGALNKHRGRGQQKVTVEYVNVEAGGQAIVGNVETPRLKSGTPQALEDRGEIPMEPPPVAKATKSRRKGKP